jgi:outer membrane protein assembly factor BamB
LKPQSAVAATMSGHRALLAALGLGLLAVSAGLTPSVAAHNPADTVFHPTPVGDRLLVVGSEGTYAYLSSQGQVHAEGNLSGDGEVLGAPVSSGDSAAVLVRSFPDTSLRLQGFDAGGPTWNLELEPAEAEAFGHLVADGGAFTAFTTEDRLLRVTPEGEVDSQAQLPATPQVEPAPARYGGWWVALEDELVRWHEGQIHERVGFEGRPTDVTASGDHVFLSLAHGGERQAELQVLDPSGELAFSRVLDGLRLGGSPAVVDDRVVVGTYDPDGARLVAYEIPNSSEAWDRQLAGATAAAPAALDGAVVVAATDTIAAYEPNGSQRWSREASPYLASPATPGDRAVPPGSANEIVAYETDGAQAWTYTDDVDQPSWTHHDGANLSGPDTAEQREGLDDLVQTPGPTAGLLLGLALVLAFATRRTRRGRL